MKRIAYILFLLPFIGFSQSEFGATLYNVNFIALTEVPELNLQTAKFQKQKNQIKTFSDFNKITSQNYWVPVNMSETIAKEESLKKRDFDVSELNMKFNLEFGTQQYARDRTTKVENRVYQEQRGLGTFNDFCSPFGFYTRPAAFQAGRGF